MIIKAVGSAVLALSLTATAMAQPPRATVVTAKSNPTPASITRAMERQPIGQAHIVRKGRTLTPDFVIQTGPLTRTPTRFKYDADQRTAAWLGVPEADSDVMDYVQIGGTTVIAYDPFAPINEYTLSAIRSERKVWYVTNGYAGRARIVRRADRIEPDESANVTRTSTLPKPRATIELHPTPKPKTGQNFDLEA